MSLLREWMHVVVWLKRHVTKKYVEPEADRLRGWLPDNCVCIDVGALAGSWTIPLSRMVPHGKVVTFEALPYYARVLRRTLWFLGCRNVEVVNQAICDQEQPIRLVWKNAHGKRLTGLTHIRGPEENSDSTITVPGTTLDAYFAAHPGNVRFLKMDIEGAELAALRGGQRLLAVQRPLIYSELNASHCARYQYTPTDIFNFYQSHNYLGFVTAPNGALEPIDATKYSTAGTQNVWFVPQEEVAAFVKRADVRIMIAEDQFQ